MYLTQRVAKLKYHTLPGGSLVCQRRGCYSKTKYCDPSCLLVCWFVRCLFVRSSDMLWDGISRKRLQTKARFQWTANRKWHMANQMVTCIVQEYVFYVFLKIRKNATFYGFWNGVSKHVKNVMQNFQVLEYIQHYIKIVDSCIWCMQYNALSSCINDNKCDWGWFLAIKV